MNSYDHLPEVIVVVTLKLLGGPVSNLCDHRLLDHSPYGQRQESQAPGTGARNAGPHSLALGAELPVKSGEVSMR